MTIKVGREQLTGLMQRQLGDEKHDASAVSALDVIWALYEHILDVSPDRMDDPDRDRFYLSKGHGPMAYYAALAAYGYLDAGVLSSYRDFDSLIGLHPDRLRTPGVEISSGSLGHGLPLGVGTALGLRLQGRTARTIVLLGDAELDEGSNHEAIAVAARFRLGRLGAIVVDNNSDSLGWSGGIASRFAVEGWVTAEVDGADQPALIAALRRSEPDRPGAVVVHVERRDA
jgi:transketolase